MRFLLLIAAVAFVPPDRPDPTPKGKESAATLAEQLIGEWRLEKAVIGGRDDALKDGPRETVLIITPKQIQVRENGNRQDRDDAAYHIDTAKKPATIDIMPMRDMKKVEGIFKIEGDQLILCFAFGGEGARPSDFVSAPGSVNAVMHFKRLKK
jgi:uncharacterized protein (TIGR03067 family)